jgi:catalase
MRTDGNYGGSTSYEPNSFGQWQQQPDFAEPLLKVTGDAAHWEHREDEDYYSQPGNLFRLMSDAQKSILFTNTAAAIGDAQEFIKIRHIRNCYQADPAYGTGVAAAIGLSMQLVHDYQG